MRSGTIFRLSYRRNRLLHTSHIYFLLVEVSFSSKSARDSFAKLISCDSQNAWMNQQTAGVYFLTASSAVLASVFDGAGGNWSATHVIPVHHTMHTSMHIPGNTSRMPGRLQLSRSVMRGDLTTLIRCLFLHICPPVTHDSYLPAPDLQVLLVRLTVSATWYPTKFRSLRKVQRDVYPVQYQQGAVRWTDISSWHLFRLTALVPQPTAKPCDTRSEVLRSASKCWSSFSSASDVRNLRGARKMCQTESKNHQSMSS